ncbi:hypothetical protein PFISCL1PPCAC_21554, partial [Pristionchus fissidentatus]
LHTAILQMEDHKVKLMAERSKVVRKRKELEDMIDKTNNEIAAKFSAIIAQAFTRCWDLMEQTKKMASSRYEKLDQRVAEIDRLVENISIGAELSYRCERIHPITMRRLVQLSATAIVDRASQLHKKFKFDDSSAIEYRPMLQVSSNSNVLNHIANFGKVILTNLTNDLGEKFQFRTIPTPLVSHAECRKLEELVAFTRFYEKAVTPKTCAKDGFRELPFQLGLRNLGNFCGSIDILLSRFFTKLSHNTSHNSSPSNNAPH